MLVDDDADDAGLFCETLTRTLPGTKCLTAENGQELFKFLSAQSQYGNKPDVIFLDINMPVMNGWECLRKLKGSSSYNSIPIIMYSTSSAKKDIDMAYSLGAMAFLTKPEDLMELSKILRIVALSPQDRLLHELKAFESVKLN
ncbi:MAG TPA: response regulator [Puia sp.]|nr:response regulator [Puia sp.]